MALKMKVDATKKDEVSREDLGCFVEKSLTDNVLQDMIFNIEDVIFIIEPWESYINFGYPEGIHKDSSWDDKISAYVNDSIF